MTEETSERVGAWAALGIHTPSTLTLSQIQSVCACALTQMPNRNQAETIDDRTAILEQIAVIAEATALMVEAIAEIKRLTK